MKHFLTLLCAAAMMPLNLWAQTDPCQNFAANFTFDPPGTNLSVAFINQSDGDYTNIVWTFGDGSTSTDLQPTHTYAAVGMYQICLTISNDWCESSTCKTVLITPLVEPTCEAFFAYQTNGLTATLNGNESGGSGEIIGWQWWLNGTMIGDGSTLTYTFPEAGEYSVCLAINTADGCTDEYCHGVAVEAEPQPCEAFFNIETDGLTIWLNGNPSVPNDLSGFTWNFGDGTANDNNFEVTHTYEQAGTYTVCLLIWNNNTDCEDDYCQTITLNETTTPTCEAFFAYQTNGLTATLNGNESGGSGEIIGWQWWLNGTMIGDGSTLTYTFPEAGEYSVCLAINTADGCTDEYCHEVAVEAEPQPCEAFFSIETNGLTIWLNGNPSVPNDLSGFTWNFGDGTANDNNFELTHTYEQAGTYTVCLLIWNNNTDCEDDYCQTITLNETTTPTCEAFFAYQTNGLTATLNGNESGGSGEIIGWQWWLNGTMIGDGSTLTYTFPEAGEYSVCLAINTADGCTDEYCHGVAVEVEPQPCEAFFSIETNGLTIWLNGNPSVPNDLSGFTWNFGDGTANDNNFELTHTYEQAGTYTVCLLIWNNNTDCEDDYCQTITLNETTTPTCEAFFAYQTNGLTATLNGNESGGSGEIIGWQWWLNGTMIGDGSTLTYTFPEAGEYSVCLAINTADGCTDEYCHEVAVEAEPQPCEAFFNIETDGLTIWLNGNPSVPNDLSGFTWNFGDGTANDNNFEVTHTYEQAGTYTVCLLIWNNNTDCEDDYCQTITLNETTTPTCEAFFAYQTNGLTATLNGNESGGSGEIIGWQWWLNGTMIGNESTLTYTFPSAGEYSVCLAINTADGCTDEYCHEVAVEVEPQPCEAFFNIETDGLTIWLNGNPSVPNDLTGFTWNFGDGTANDNNFELTHTYEQAGTYTVCLLIWNNNTDCEDDYCQTITLNETTTPTCEAFFAYQTNGLTATLNGNESGGSGEIIGWQWWLNGTMIGNESTLTYTFPSAGEYSVCLAINTADGCTDEYCHGVAVNSGDDPCPTLSVDFTYEFNENPLSVHFIRFTEGAGAGAQFLWAFGDGSNSTTNNPTHIYTSAGTYSVCLTVTTASGCTEQYCQLVVVSAATGECNANFTYTLNDGIGIFSAAASTSNGNIIAYSWWRGSSLVGISPTVTLNFATSGTYNICLTITTDNGCTDEVCQTVVVTVEPPPANGMTINPNIIYQTLPLSIALQSPQTIAVALLDINGQVAYQQSIAMETGINQSTLDISPLSAGMYFVRITLADGTILNRKVIIAD